MPWPEIAYITKAMTTSCQPRPQPHMTGTAAATAISGTAMNRASSTCSTRARPIVLGSDASGLGSGVVIGALVIGGVGWVVVGAVMLLLVRRGLRASYATVTYATVTLWPGC